MKGGLKTMIIRWLGAFRKQGSLYSALVWEVTQTTRKHVAAERLQRGKSYIFHARVGLLIKNSAVVRRYRSDVWSEYTRTGALKKTRKEGKNWSGHTEVWARPVYIGVVLKDVRNISQSALQAVKRFTDEFEYDVFVLNPATRRLEKVKLVATKTKKGGDVNMC
jgi:hypothetical protein